MGRVGQHLDEDIMKEAARDAGQAETSADKPALFVIISRAELTMSVDCSLALGDAPGEGSASARGDASASSSSSDSMCSPPRTVKSSAVCTTSDSQEFVTKTRRHHMSTRITTTCTHFCTTRSRRGHPVA